jgi:hypothetical protein
MKLTNKLTREKHYRLVIYSKDVIAGDEHNGVYEVSVPDHILDNNDYHIAVEHFCHNGDVLSATPGLRVIIPELSVSQPDTYSTSTKTNSTVVCVLPRSAANTPVAFQQSITSKTYGIPLVDTTFLRTKQVRITLKGLNDVIHSDTSLGNDSIWCMVLVIYPFEK